MTFIKTTEQSSKYEHLEKMSVTDLLSNINNEDKTVPLAVEKALLQIETLVTQIVAKMKPYSADLQNKYARKLKIMKQICCTKENLNYRN